MITAEIAGYTLAAENHCADCMGDIARAHVRAVGGATDCDTEAAIALWAAMESVDREYADSEDFPVPFSIEQARHDAEWAEHERDSIPRCKCGNDFLGEF